MESQSIVQNVERRYIGMTNNKITDIESKMPHEISEVICINCKHRWIDVRPAGLWLMNLECPECCKTGYIIETGQVIQNES